MKLADYEHQAASWDGNLAWVTSEDEYLRNRAVAKLRRPQTLFMRGKETRFAAVVEALASDDMFGTAHSEVILADVHLAPAAEQEGIAKLLPDLSGRIAFSSPTLDKRRKLYKAAKKAKAWFVELEPLVGGAFSAWLKQSAAEHRVFVPPHVMRVLDQNLEGEPAAACGVLEKLALLDAAPTVEVAEKLCGQRRFGTVFEMALCALEGDAGKSMAILFQLFREGSAPLQICGTLAWVLKRLCTAAYMWHHKTPWAEIQKELRVYHDEHRFKELMQAADPSVHLRRLEMLWETSASLKGGSAELPVTTTWQNGEREQETRKVWGLGLNLEFPETQMMHLLQGLATPSS